MKSKLLRSSVSLLLALLLCASSILPSAFASSSGDAATGAEGVVIEKHAPEAKIKLSNVMSVFGDDDASGLYYGIAPIGEPESITNVTSSSSPSVTAGEYLAYKTTAYTGSRTRKADWTQTDQRSSLGFFVRTYFNMTARVRGCSDGGLFLDGAAVDGVARLWYDGSYTVTAQAVEGYTYTVSGVTEGEPFTPTADFTVTADYIADANAPVILNVGEGGTAKIMFDGEDAIGPVPAGKTFVVAASENENRGYRFDSITVTKDGTPIEPIEGTENEYGPAEENAVYEVTVTFLFDPHVVNYEINAASPKLYITDFISMFGGTIGSYSYGYAPVDKPDSIKSVGLLSSATLAPGEYYIYRASSGSSWANAKLYLLRLRSYYKAVFTVNGHDEGEVYLNGEAVSGTVRLYTDETYTVKSKHIDEYICTIYGVTEGEEFTPANALDITAAYAKERYAVFTLSCGEGGSAEVEIDGEAAIERISEGSTFVVVPHARSGADYYTQSITVTRNGEAVAPVEGTENEFGPVADGEVYEISVTFARATLTVNDCDVILTDIMRGDYNAVAQSILANAEITPAAFADQAQGSVQYVAYKLLGIEIYEPLRYSGDLSHDFGTSVRGGELLEGNTEKVRVTYRIPAYDLELQATATVTVRDTREHCTVGSNQTVTITYGDDLKAALFDHITVRNASGERVAFTEDDIVILPAVPNAGTTEVTVRYNGSDIYAVSEGTAQVRVNRAPSSLKIENETIAYGEVPSATVTTDPEGLDHMLVIAGIDGDAQGFVNINIPESVRERMKFKLGDVVLLDVYQVIRSYIGEGTDVNSFRELLNSLYDTINSSEAIREAMANSGFNMEALDAVMRFINELPQGRMEILITLDRVPTDAGAYLVSAFSTDPNYTFSTDVAYLFIRPAVGILDDVKLRFRTELESGRNVITLDAAQDFVFGGALYVNDTMVESAKIRTFYTGVTVGGEVIAQEEPVRTPGVYTETVYILSGNYLPDPIERTYTVTRLSTELTMQDLTVEYDGERHPLEAFFEDGTQTEGRITYTYIGRGYLSAAAPSDAGEYTVTARFSGDETHKACDAAAKLKIKKRKAVVRVTCAEQVAYGEITVLDTSAANVGYTVSGVLDGESIGIVIPSLGTTELVPDSGKYTATATLLRANSNYAVTVEDAVLTIVPRSAVITLASAEKTLGEKDPALTYTIENVLRTDRATVKLSREKGEAAGEYAINAEVTPDPNYSYTVVPAVLTIRPRAVLVSVDNAEKLSTEEDPAFSFKVTDASGKPIKCEIPFTAVRAAGDEPGEYEITVAFEENTDYAVTIRPGVLTIHPEPVSYTVGDVNGDGAVNNRDAMILDRYIAGWEGYDHYVTNPDAADLNRDKTVDDRDALILDRYIAGWDGYDRWIIVVYAAI